MLCVVLIKSLLTDLGVIVSKGVPGFDTTLEAVLRLPPNKIAVRPYRSLSRRPRGCTADSRSPFTACKIGLAALFRSPPMQELCLLPNARFSFNRFPAGNFPDFPK